VRLNPATNLICNYGQIQRQDVVRYAWELFKSEEPCLEFQRRNTGKHIHRVILSYFRTFTLNTLPFLTASLQLISLTSVSKLAVVPSGLSCWSFLPRYLSQSVYLFQSWNPRPLVVSRSWRLHPQSQFCSAIAAYTKSISRESPRRRSLTRLRQHRLRQCDRNLILQM
jgi:hypothetical protein